MAKTATTRAGGQLGRTETVTIRLDPRLNYLCELAARSQRRTKSSFIESIIDEKLDEIPLDKRLDAEPRPTIGRFADRLWDVREHERLINLAFLAPNLLTFEEEQIWTTIREADFFWHGEWLTRDGELDFFWACEPDTLRRDRIQAHWETIRAVAEKKLDKERLPQLERPQAAAGSSLDDEIPF